MKPLLIPVPLYEGESLQGLVVRADEANYYDSLDVTLGLPSRHRNAAQLLRSCTQGEFNAEDLARRTHNRVSDIQAAQLRLAPPVIGRKTDQYLVYARWRQCPQCFEQAPFHRRLWALTYVTACPTHQAELIDTCGACGSALKLGREYSDKCPKCKAPLCLGPRASSSAVAFAQAAERGLAAHTAGDSRPLAELHARVTAAIMLTDPKYLAVRCRLSPQLMGMDQMAPLIDQLGAFALSDEALGAYAQRVVSTLKKRWVHLQRASTVTVKHVADVAGAATPLGLRNALAVASAGLLQVHDAETPFLVPPAKWEVPSTVVADILGVKPCTLRRLLSTGILGSRLRWRTNSHFGGLHLVSLNGLEALMTQLHDVADGVETAGATKLSRIVGFEGEKIISQALLGELRVYRGEGEGLEAFWVRYGDTGHAAKRRSYPEGYFTVEQASKRLMTYRSVVDRLMDIGTLKTKPWHGGQVRLIERGSLEAFDREFVLVGALAKQHGLNSTNLAEKLQSFGVRAVMGPEIDGGLVKVFRREDVAEVDFRQVKMLKGYETRTGRKNKQLGR